MITLFTTYVSFLLLVVSVHSFVFQFSPCLATNTSVIRQFDFNVGPEDLSLRFYVEDWWYPRFFGLAHCFRLNQMWPVFPNFIFFLKVSFILVCPCHFFFIWVSHVENQLLRCCLFEPRRCSADIVTAIDMRQLENSNFESFFPMFKVVERWCDVGLVVEYVPSSAWPLFQNKLMKDTFLYLMVFDLALHFRMEIVYLQCECMRTWGYSRSIFIDTDWFSEARDLVLLVEGGLISCRRWDFNIERLEDFLMLIMVEIEVESDPNDSSNESLIFLWIVLGHCF